MKIRVHLLSALALALTVAAPMAASAVQGNALHKKGEVVMKQGSTVHLFHSGTADVRRDICLNDVMPVYRESIQGGHSASVKVGMVKVISYQGDHYFEAQVLEGSVKPGDIAKRKSATCLIAEMH